MMENLESLIESHFRVVNIVNRGVAMCCIFDLLATLSICPAMPGSSSTDSRRLEMAQRGKRSLLDSSSCKS